MSLASVEKKYQKGLAAIQQRIYDLRTRMYPDEPDEPEAKV